MTDTPDFDCPVCRDGGWPYSPSFDLEAENAFAARIRGNECPVSVDVERFQRALDEIARLRSVVREVTRLRTELAQHTHYTASRVLADRQKGAHGLGTAKKYPWPTTNPPLEMTADDNADTPNAAPFDLDEAMEVYWHHYIKNPKSTYLTTRWFRHALDEIARLRERVAELRERVAELEKSLSRCLDMHGDFDA